MSLTVAEFAKINDLKVDDAIDILNTLFIEYDYNYFVSEEDDILDENVLEFLEDKGFIIDESKINDFKDDGFNEKKFNESNLNEDNLKENTKGDEDLSGASLSKNDANEIKSSSNLSSQINFSVEEFFYAYKYINVIEDDFDKLSNAFNIEISCEDIDLSNFYNAQDTIKFIKCDIITDLKEKINDVKNTLEVNDANVALLFKFLDGDFNDEEGFYDYDLIEDAMDEAGLKNDIYGLMDTAEQYNQMLTDYYFEAEWQEGTFLKENGEINYDAIDEYLSENENVSLDVVERCKENQLFLNALGNGNLNSNDGEIDRDKVGDYIAEHPLVTDVDTIIENYELQVVNTNFINNFETLFMDEEGNINENKLNQYLEDNPKVSIDIAEQVVNTIKDNNLFQKEMEEGNFFDLDGNVDLSLVKKFIEEHPYTTMNTEEVFNQYEENYANLKLWEEYEKGTFKDSIGNWNEDAYLNYVKEHPNATNGEDVKEWHLNEYPDLTLEEVQQQTTQTVTVSFAYGVVDIFETVVDGGAYLLGTVGDALGIEGSKETMGQFIQNDYSGQLYDSWTGALGVRSDIAYGEAHIVGTVAGKIVGTVLFSAIPGGCAVSATVGALSAAGSAAETAFQSGADVDSAFKVAGGAFVLGAISGYGLDKVASSVELGTLSLKHGLGAATLVSAVEPIGNSIIEYNSYGNKLVDSEGNVLYDNYLDYYVESGALLNTGIAIAGSSLRIGSSYLKGKTARQMTVEDNVKQALPEGKEKVQVIDQDVNGEVAITEYDADDSMFKSSTNMDDYVDVDNVADYSLNKALVLGVSTDNVLEVLDDTADSVDDVSKGLTKVANATDNGIKKIQDIDNIKLIGDKYSGIEVLESVDQLDEKLLDVVDNVSDTVGDTSIELIKNQFNLEDLGNTTDDVEKVLNSMDDDTFNNLVSKLVKSEKLSLIKDDVLLNKVVGTYIFYQNGGSIDTSEFVEMLKRLSTEQAFSLLKSFSPKMSAFENMTKDLGVELNADLIVECYKSPNDAIKKLLVNMENMTSIEKTNFYVKYINYFNGEGVSIFDFYKSFGIDTKVLSSSMKMAEFFGDKKLFLLESLKQKMNGLSVESSEYDEILKLVSKYSKMPVADIDVTQLELEAEKFISSTDLSKYSNLKTNYILNDVNCTYEELASIFNYTNCGGYEINVWLFDGSLQGVKARWKYKSIYDIQNLISGYEWSDGLYVHKNKVFYSMDGDILEQLDTIIKKGNYEDAIITFRGVKELYNDDVRLNIDDLRVGDSFSSGGYQSSSVLFEKCFGVTNDDINNILQIIVPPNSGVGAYIENISGCPNYSQAEFLIKRNAKMTVVGDIYKTIINGVEKTIIPVVVQ